MASSDVADVRTTGEGAAATGDALPRCDDRFEPHEAERAQAYLDMAGTVLVALDARGCVTMLNRKGAQVTGYAPEELLGKEWVEHCVPAAVRMRTRAVFNELMAGRVTLAEYHENSILTKTGEERLIAWHNTVLKDLSGATVGTLSSGEDITERRAAERDLRRTTESLESRVRELFCLYSLSRLFEQPDIAFEALFLGTIEALGSAWHRHAALRARVTYGGNSWGAETAPAPGARMSADIRVGGARAGVLEAAAAAPSGEGDDPFSEEDRRLLTAVADWLGRTIEHRLARDELMRTLKELERSNTELEQFAYVASHDLQEPLRMVASYVQLLEHRYKDRLEKDAHEFIDFAVQGVRRMQDLIRDLLSYSRAGRGERALAPCDCEEILRGVLLDMRATIDEAKASVTHDPLPTVTADGVQLRQLLQNLLSNAVKFRAERAAAVHIGAEERGGEWVFSVRDNGIGIDPKYHERLFKIFQRLHTREKYAGTGIGLAVCRKIVERHGGKIWLESTPGNGSTFFFTLPIESGRRPDALYCHRSFEIPRLDPGKEA